MTDDRITTHLAFHLGKGTVAETLEPVEIWRHTRPEFTTFATHGLSSQPITTVYPQELVCSVEHGQDGAAASLVRRTLDLILNAHHGVLNDQIITGDGPLLARTNITGVLVGAHPYFEDEFNAVFDGHQNVVCELMTLVPLTGTETSQANDFGVDALLDTLEQNNPPLLDVTRA